MSDWVGPVLAAALLGLGLGAAAAAVSGRLRSERASAMAAAAAAASAALSLPAWLWAAAAGLPSLGLAAPVLAFAAAGAALAGVFARLPRHAARLYRADLAAAAAAAVLAPIALGALGAMGAVLASAVLLSGAALALSWGLGRAAARSVVPLALVPVALVVAAAGGWPNLEPELHMRGKPIVRTLHSGGTVEATRWDATARTDLVALPGGARYLFMDGGAGSVVPDADPNRWIGDVGAFAFAAGPADRAFLIGPGGGLDVVQARVHGVREVVAAEVNAASVELARALGAAAGNPYDERTTVLIEDGRRALARLPGRFDVITLANVVTGAAELRGAALTENLVYTVEAFEGYLERLSERGRIALTLYDEPTLTRAVTTALTALVRGGHAPDHAAAMHHLVAVLDAGAQPPVPALLVARTAYAPEAAVAVARVAEARGWALLLVPGLLAPPALERVAAGAWTLDQLLAASDIELAPATDDRPYFFAFEPDLPRPVRQAGVLALASAAVLVLAAVPAGVVTARRRPGSPALAARVDGSRRWLAAAALGAAFLTLELHALQLVQRSLGHPAWSLSVTLGAVLLGGALGAALAARRSGGAPHRPALLSAVAVLVWALAAPGLADAVRALPLALAAVVVAVPLAAVAVPMGMPFPRVLAGWHRPSGVAAAWAASGLAAVAAGAGAMWLAHAHGASMLAVLAAALYVAAAVIHPAASNATADNGAENR